MCLIQLLFVALLGAGCAGEEPLAALYVPATQRCELSVTEPSPLRTATTTPITDEPAPDNDTFDEASESDASESDASESDASESDASEASLIDINTATSEELQRLPRVGPAVAQRIIDYRERRRFRRPRDIMRVRGIGPATYEKLRPLIRVR